MESTDEKDDINLMVESSEEEEGLPEKEEDEEMKEDQVFVNGILDNYMTKASMVAMVNVGENGYLQAML